jgi:hypothetical protein
MRRSALLLCAAAALAAAGSAGAKTLPGISSPSGNIRCLLVSAAPEELLCDLKQADYASKLVHHCASAPYFVDWAGFSLSAAGKSVVACAGGPAYDPSTEHPRYATIAYGRSWHRGPFTCRSAQSGMTCINSAGHGFFLSRQAWRSF